MDNRLDNQGQVRAVCLEDDDQREAIRKERNK